jgi:outer membrane protein TolC
MPRALRHSLLLTASILVLAACSVRPEPLETLEIAKSAAADQSLIATSEEELTEPLDLSGAVARALKYNLAHRVQIMEAALANKSFELAKMDMLPILAANGSVSARNNDNASSSESVLTRRQSLEPSTSEDRERATASARFSWNILDFGISYLQAKQEADRYLVAELTRQKAMMQLVQQVRTAYWRAAAMQMVSDRVDKLLAETTKSRQDLDRVFEQRLRPPLQVLEEMRSLSEVIQQLETMKQSISAAKVDLAALINVPPGKNIPLATPANLPAMPAPPMDLDRMEQMALINSGDYAAQLYNIRIEHIETRKALLRLLPGVELFSSANWDTNSFLYNNAWADVGARVNWNIMRLLASDEIADLNEGRKQLAMARRLATNMAVITRLRLSHETYVNALERLKRASDIDRIDGEIRRLTAQSEASSATAAIARVQSEVRALRSTVAGLLAYADAQTAYGQHLVSMGLSVVPDDYQSKSVQELAGLIDQSFKRWDAGDYGELPVIEAVAPLAQVN